MPIIPMIVWGAQRMWTKDHPRNLGRKKIPITVAVGAPLSAAGDGRGDRRRDAGRDDRAAARGAGGLPASRGRVLGAAAARRRAPTMEEAKVLEEAELAERARKRAERSRKPPVTLPALIATDVDGTLLDDDEKVTPRTRDAVHAAVDAGAQFVLATGRPPRWVRPVVDALGFAPMAVCANGAVIYDPSTDRIVSARTLSADVLGRARRDRHPRHPGRRAGRRTGGPQRPRRGHAAVRQLAGLRACLAQPGQHRGVRRGPAQCARGQAADPQGGRAQRRHGGRARQTHWSAR